MRVVVVAFVVLLSGCSEGAPEGEEEPIAGPVQQDEQPEAVQPEALEMEAGGSMLLGVDESWLFEVGPEASMIKVRLTAVPMAGQMVLSELTAQAHLNGTVVEDGSVPGFEGWVGMASERHLIDISQRIPANRDPATFAGQWELVLRGDPQVADYHVGVRIEY